MNNKMTSLFLGVSMGLSSIVSPMSVMAQTMQDTPNDTLTAPTTNTEVAGSTTNFLDGVDWTWVLPVLLLIPLLLLLTREKRVERFDSYGNRRFAGTKGGRAIKRRPQVEDIDEVDEYPEDEDLI